MWQVLDFDFAVVSEMHQVHMAVGRGDSGQKRTSFVLVKLFFC